MSDSDLSDVPSAEFLDDYFAECDEHLAAARAGLLALDGSVGQEQVDRSSLDELFRNFHSLKGLSAMVGVRPAEQLAHQMESYLGALRKGQLRLTPEGLETLIASVKTLEQVIAARRTQTPPPDIEARLLELTALLPAQSAAAGPAAASAATADRGPFELPPEKSRLLAARVADGDRAWRFTFVPSATLAERGVNVNTIRQRLQEVGELIHAEPFVLTGGQIAFAFLVASRADESTFAAWQQDGLSFTPQEMPAPAGQPASDSKESGTRPGSVPGSALMPSNVVRVDLARLDELMRLVGELVISRARLDETLQRVGDNAAPEWRAVQETNHALERQLRDLRAGVMRVRLVPVREIFARMQFVVRDLTREHGKKVTLTLSGQGTEIDKFVVERMLDPLLHLVRNAVSHGLESPEKRVAQGKPPEGQLALRASAVGETVLIEIEDDGRGIDAEAVTARARLAGLASGATLDNATLLDLICMPGFSTRDEADRASGRGVGMAVVRGVVEELGGSLTLDTRPGRYTRFTIRLPLTLVIADALIVTVGGQTFAVPQVAVSEVLQVEPGSLQVLENNELLPYREGALPLVRLAAFFGLPEPTDRAFHVLVIGAVGLAVERVVGLREIVVRPLTDPLVRVPGIAGATELGDGRVVLILDTMTLARAARTRRAGIRARAERPKPVARLPA